MKNVSLFLSIHFRLSNTLALIGDSVSRLNILRPLNVLFFFCCTYAFEASAAAKIDKSNYTARDGLISLTNGGPNAAIDFV